MCIVSPLAGRAQHLKKYLNQFELKKSQLLNKYMRLSVYPKQNYLSLHKEMADWLSNFQQSIVIE